MIPPFPSPVHAGPSLPAGCAGRSGGCILASSMITIGLTYDLRSYYLAQGYSEEDTAEFDRDDTIEAIAAALEALGHRPERIGAVTQLVPRLAAGERWDLVFNIAEGIHGFARESQVPALLDAYRIPYTFSDPVVLGICLHKGWAKRVIRDLGLPTPDFVVVAGEEDLPGVRLQYPLFAKPIAEGTGKGVTASSKIGSRAELEAQCRELLGRYRQPVLVERFLPGREYTVGIVGTGPKARAVGTLEVLLRKEAEREVYSYLNKEQCEQLVDYRLADDPQARETALAVWRALGCRDAGRVDLREDEHGVPNIIELNPLAGLHPQHSDLPILCGMAGIPFLELIRQIVDSARERGSVVH
jgi:D-alanine-D-alanine ligase